MIISLTWKKKGNGPILLRWCIIYTVTLYSAGDQSTKPYICTGYTSLVTGSFSTVTCYHKLQPALPGVKGTGSIGLLALWTRTWLISDCGCSVGGSIGLLALWTRTWLISDCGCSVGGRTFEELHVSCWDLFWLCFLFSFFACASYGFLWFCLFFLLFPPLLVFRLFCLCLVFSRSFCDFWLFWIHDLVTCHEYTYRLYIFSFRVLYCGALFLPRFFCIGHFHFPPLLSFIGDFLMKVFRIAEYGNYPFIFQSAPSSVNCDYTLSLTFFLDVLWCCESFNAMFGMLVIFLLLIAMVTGKSDFIMFQSAWEVCD